MRVSCHGQTGPEPGMERRRRAMALDSRSISPSRFGLDGTGVKARLDRRRVDGWQMLDQTPVEQPLDLAA